MDTSLCSKTSVSKSPEPANGAFTTSRMTLVELQSVLLSQSIPHYVRIPSGSYLASSFDVYYGFWQSHGSVLPKGPMLTLDPFWFKVFNAALLLILVFSVSRTWRIFAAILFATIFSRAKCCAQQSQCAALLANTPDPRTALWTSSKLSWHGDAEGTLRKTMHR